MRVAKKIRWAAMGLALSAAGCNAGDQIGELLDDLGNIDLSDATKDSDNDGIPDVQEGNGDADGDGIPAYLDPDERGNTPIVNEWPADSGVATLDGTTPNPTVDASTTPMYDGCGVVSAEAQFERSPVDVVWAIDNSGSMSDDFLNVSAGIDEFTRSVDSSGANMHVVMVSTFVIGLPQNVQSDMERYMLRPVDVQSWNAFRVLLNDYDNYSSFLRPEASTHFIIVTDDNSDTSHTEFRTQMEARLGHEFTFHGITSAGGVGIGAIFGYPNAYPDLANETGGLNQSIGSDWSTIFDQLQSAVVQTAEIPCEVPVSNENNADLDNVSVLYTPTDGTQAPFPKAENAEQCGDAEAWYYDSNETPTRIFLCPAACEGVKAGGNLDVVIACEPPPALI